MAAPMKFTVGCLSLRDKLNFRVVGRCFNALAANDKSQLRGTTCRIPHYSYRNEIFRCSSTNQSGEKAQGPGRRRITIPGVTSVIAGTGLMYYLYKYFSQPTGNVVTEMTHAIQPPPPQKIAREMSFPGDKTGLKLTLYQYQTCPFCCKARAFLDYYGISYKVVEVNSVTRKEKKWSKYKKVPMLLVEQDGKEEVIQIKDSSVIMSVLKTYLLDIQGSNIADIVSKYVMLEIKEGKKTTYECDSRYFIMYGDDHERPSDKELQKELKWRKWVDSDLVHMLSPNVYRTPSESLQTFHYFSEIGEWEKNFDNRDRLLAIYGGSFIMYFIARKLAKKYGLKSDVRESLYDACNTWTKQLGKKPFHGGKEPDLSDLSVYGVLHSIEGCAAFQDMCYNTKIKPWYDRMKKACEAHSGMKRINANTA